MPRGEPTPCYPSGMVWEPFALAVVMGLLVSAAIYFILMWPQVEPDDEPSAAPTPEVSSEE